MRRHGTAQGNSPQWWVFMRAHEFSRWPAASKLDGMPIALVCAVNV
jgi:hypothetical protein